MAELTVWTKSTRLIVNSADRSEPENATAQTTPSRFTIVAHMWLLRPLVSADTAATSAALSCACVGRPAQAAWAPATVLMAAKLHEARSAVLNAKPADPFIIASFVTMP